MEWIVTLTILAVFIGLIIFMIKVPPDADKGPFNYRPGLAAELAAHRRKKRLKRMKDRATK